MRKRSMPTHKHIWRHLAARLLLTPLALAFVHTVRSQTVLVPKEREGATEAAA